MTSVVEIRLLDRDDDRSDFSCGHPDLDRYFQHYAGQNQFKLHLAVTYVAVMSGRIVGFATVAASSLERSRLPSPQQRRRLPAYPLPVLRLARLAVDVRAQGVGIGRALLSYVLGLTVQQRDWLGCVGLVTDAKPEAVRFYEDLGFVPLTNTGEGLLAGEPLPMFLGIDSIAATISRRPVGAAEAQDARYG